MGIFSFFRNRKASESALSPDHQAAIEQAMAQAQVQSGQSGQPGQASFQVTETGGADVLAGLGTLISQLQAMKGAGLDVETSSQVIDMRGSGLREEIMGVIAAHGIDPTQEGQQIDASAAPDLQTDILAVLARAGIDVNAAGFPMQIETPGSQEPPEPLDPTVPQIRNPLDR